MYTNSMIVSVSTQLLNHHQNLISEHLYHPRKKPLTHLQLFPILPPGVGNH